MEGLPRDERSTYVDALMYYVVFENRRPRN